MILSLVCKSVSPNIREPIQSLLFGVYLFMSITILFWPNEEKTLELINRNINRIELLIIFVLIYKLTISENLTFRNLSNIVCNCDFSFIY